MPKSKTKKWKKIVISLVILGVIAGGLNSALHKKPMPLTIQKEKVARRTITELVEANGKIQPVTQVKISPEVSGEIIQLPVKEGQTVKKGDLLVKIKPDNYIASRNSAAASFLYSQTSSNSAAASLERAELEYNRVTKLHDSQLVSDSAFQEAKMSYQVAQASFAGAKQQVDMAKASLQKAEDDLSKTTIYSPLDGTVTKLNSQLGERVVGTAMMAGTEIMTVSDLNEMETRVDIGETDVVLIQVGQNARLEVDAFKDKKFHGTVTEIANSAKTTVSSSSQEATKFEVKIRVTEKEAFRPGMSVTAKIETRSVTNVLSVPIQSVTTRPPKSPSKTNVLAKVGQTNSASTNGPEAATATSSNVLASSEADSSTNSAARKKNSDVVKNVDVVFVVENGKAVMKPVKRGICDDSYYEILEGVKEGEEVVSGGFKVISKELEDGKDVMVGANKTEGSGEKK
jgi:HlyD family secretion protein